MGDRRETRGTNWRVREAIGVRMARPRRQSELANPLKHGDASDYDHIAELLGSHRWPADEDRQ